MIMLVYFPRAGHAISTPLRRGLSSRRGKREQIALIYSNGERRVVIERVIPSLSIPPNRHAIPGRIAISNEDTETGPAVLKKRNRTNGRIRTYEADGIIPRVFPPGTWNLRSERNRENLACRFIILIASSSEGLFLERIVYISC